MTRSDKSKKDSTPEPASISARRDRSIDKSLDGITRRKVSRTRWLRAVKRMRQLSTTVNELRAENEALRRLAYQDALTALINRRGFDEHLGLALAEHAEHSRDLAVILLDVDDLKHINDTRGHAAGDSALRIVADSLRRAVRLGDYVARLGGDEFAVLLPRTNEARARGIAEGVRAALHQASTLAGHSVTVSAGVAEVRRDDPVERQADLLLQRADGALYAAKNAGRDRVVQIGGNEITALASHPDPSRRRIGRNDLRTHRLRGRDDTLTVWPDQQHAELLGGGHQLSLHRLALFARLPVSSARHKGGPHPLLGTGLKKLDVDPIRGADEDQVRLVRG